MNTLLSNSQETLIPLPKDWIWDSRKSGCYYDPPKNNTEVDGDPEVYQLFIGKNPNFVRYF